WRGEAASLDFHLGRGDTNLMGNGAAPIEEIARDYNAIFTAPDNTKNELDLASLQGSFDFSDATKLSFTAYHREVDTTSYNGDSSDAEECEDDEGEEVLCDDDG